MPESKKGRETTKNKKGREKGKIKGLPEVSGCSTSHFLRGLGLISPVAYYGNPVFQGT